MFLTKENGIYRVGDLCVNQIGMAEQDTLAEIYIRIKREGLLPILFQESQPDLITFASLYLEQRGLTMLCFTGNNESMPVDVCGIGHVTAPRSMGAGYLKSEVSMLFFRGRQRRSMTIPFAQMMIEMAFDIPNLYTLCGCTPFPNLAAARFIEAVGFKRLPAPLEGYSTWHGEPCSCWISSLTRPRWQTIRPFQDSVA